MNINESQKGVVEVVVEPDKIKNAWQSMKRAAAYSRYNRINDHRRSIVYPIGLEVVLIDMDEGMRHDIYAG